MECLACLFCKMNFLLVTLAYVARQTSIPNSKNGLMRELYNVFIVTGGKYFDNLNNMPSYLNIFRAITSTLSLNEFLIKHYCQEINIIGFLYSCNLLVKFNRFLDENIIYFVLSALIQVRFDVSQLLTLLSSCSTMSMSLFII